MPARTRCTPGRRVPPLPRPSAGRFPSENGTRVFRLTCATETAVVSRAAAILQHARRRPRIGTCIMPCRSERDPVDRRCATCIWHRRRRSRCRISRLARMVWRRLIAADDTRHSDVVTACAPVPRTAADARGRRRPRRRTGSFERALRVVQ